MTLNHRADFSLSPLLRWKPLPVASCERIGFDAAHSAHFGKMLFLYWCDREAAAPAGDEDAIERAAWFGLAFQLIERDVVGKFHDPLNIDHHPARVVGIGFRVVIVGFGILCGEIRVGFADDFADSGNSRWFGTYNNGHPLHELWMVTDAVFE